MAQPGSTPVALTDFPVDPEILTSNISHFEWISADEIIFDKSASKDKDYVVIEGALHGFGPCTACEKTKGQYSNTVKNLFYYIRDWTNKRF